MTLLDGKAVAKKIHEETWQLVEALVQEHGMPPGLAVVRIGQDEASRIYVNMKVKKCKEVGIYSQKMELSEDISEDALVEEVRKLNADPKIHGILVQLPLPKRINTERIIDEINVSKDVDGFHPESVGRLSMGQAGFVACTPLGILRILDEYEIPLKGAEAVVVGRSNIVGKPVAQLLLSRHATVTICHSRTKDLAAVCRRADVLVAAVGRAEMVRGDWVKEGAAVVDVGVNRKDDGKLVGDVAFDEAKERAGWITPVPGGVGPLTIAMLLSNTALSAKQHLQPK